MTESKIEAEEKKKLLSLKRRYRRAGYAVRTPNGRSDTPEFLRGYVPDLIAEREGDCVIIEVKRNKALRGSNDLVDIAERVAATPGWRFELVTYVGDDIVRMPHHGSFRYFIDVVEKAYEADVAPAAYLYLSSLIEVLLRDLAFKQGVDDRRLSVSSLARELVTRGIISREVLATIQDVIAKRDELAHAPKTAVPTRKDLEGLTATMQKLRTELVSDAA